MKESPILEHWGRLQKKVDAEGGGKEVLEEDEDDEDGALDLKTMAKQVDLKAIHAVLKVRICISLLSEMIPCLTRFCLMLFPA